MSSWFPPPSKPRPVEDGIAARSKRGAIAQTWWSERFITVLESIGFGSRMQRGRRYARAGQVVDLQTRPGAVTATVQGSRARPYHVRLGLTAFDKTQWAQVSQALADDAWYAANLLSGNMPEDIEDVFEQVGLSLFPETSSDLSLDCSCPDMAVPCKHIAAVFYLLAESFDDDPFAILAWRGRQRDDLLTAVEAQRSSGPPAADRAGPEQPTAAPLSDVLASFFSAQAEIPLRERAHTSADSLLDQVPPVEVSIRGRDLIELLRTTYLEVGDNG